MAISDPSRTLQSIGINTESEYTILYNYTVKQRPLLNTPLNYKVLEQAEDILAQVR